VHACLATIAPRPGGGIHVSDMHQTDDANDTLRLAILTVLATREMPMTAQEIADELARLALEGQRLALSSGRERGH
jgi:hypothetical protein